MRSSRTTPDGTVVGPTALPSAGAGARCATELSRQNAADTLRAELRRWLSDHPWMT